MIKCIIPLGEEYYIAIRVCPIWPIAPGSVDQEVIISTETKEYRLEVKKVKHFLEPDGSSAHIYTEAISSNILRGHDVYTEDVRDNVLDDNDIMSIAKDIMQRYDVIDYALPHS